MGRLPGVCVLGLMLLVSTCGGGGPTGKYGPLEVLTIRVTGDDFDWYNQYPGVDGQLDTEDDVISIRSLHVPANARTTLELTSRDYVYTLALPHLGLKEVAVPEMIFTLEFQEPTRGTYALRGDQLCGYAHPRLIGELVVESPGDFEAWLDGLEPER